MTASLALYYILALLLPLNANASRDPIVWLLAAVSSLMFFAAVNYAMKMPPIPEDGTK